MDGWCVRASKQAAAGQYVGSDSTCKSTVELGFGQKMRGEWLVSLMNLAMTGKRRREANVYGSKGAGGGGRRRRRRRRGSRPTAPVRSFGRWSPDGRAGTLAIRGEVSRLEILLMTSTRCVCVRVCARACSWPRIVHASGSFCHTPIVIVIVTSCMLRGLQWEAGWACVVCTEHRFFEVGVMEGAGAEGSRRWRLDAMDLSNLWPGSFL
jgi:hypothetical protein